MPDYKDMIFSDYQQIPLTLICDNIRDPGNMGTILRSMAAVGCHNVVLLKGCVDIWDPKVLRAGAGAHFRVPIIDSVEWRLMNNYIKPKSSLYLADNLVNILEEDVLANEVFDLQDNGDDHVDDEYSDLEDGPGEYEIDQSTGLIMDSLYDDDAKLEKYSRLKLPLIPYTDIGVSDSRDIVLVIGGETHGLSNAALKLAYDCDGCRVNIPMTKGSDSLNAAIATSIIAFEIRRQFHALVEQNTVA